MLLNFAIILFVGGVLGMLRDRAMRAVKAGRGLESDDVKVRISRRLAKRVLIMADCCCCIVVCGICIRELHARDALLVLSGFTECKLIASGLQIGDLVPRIRPFWI